MILDRQFRLPDVISWVGVAFVMGWLASSGYYNLAHLWQQKNQLQTIQTSTLPKLKAQANCEHIRANINEQIAQEAIEGARPLPDDVAPDCVHVAITK